MCEKHLWKSDILSKDPGWWPASLLKMSPFHWCFSHISLVKTIHLVSPYSVASRCILVPFERMGAQKNVPKKVLVTRFPYIFHVKPKWNIAYKYLKTKIFSRDSNILPQMHWTSNIFEHSATVIGVFWLSLNYPIIHFKKTVCPKNVWMRHCHKWNIGW